ncbi:MAG: GxxExxY protein [Pirellula sp.]|jgi:GxxExxY protein|nr:GxxExxY protein [Pirellula sp.]
MPITTSVPVRHCSQEEFGNVAYEVVHHALEVHTELGRIFHESIYRSTLNQLFGRRAIQEFEICLTHRGFRKELYIDLLVDLGCPFELKAASSLIDAHQSQLIQYLMLTGLSHGKLINFGAERVEHRFVNCHETSEHRRNFQIDRIAWNDYGPTDSLEQIVVPLLRDWGTGLSRSLYREAVIALAGGDEQCNQFTETYWQGQRTGRQPVSLINHGVAFEITCKKKDLDHYESHLRRFLSNTDLQSILWVNITSGSLRLQRIKRE